MKKVVREMRKNICILLCISVLLTGCVLRDTEPETLDNDTPINEPTTPTEINTEITIPDISNVSAASAEQILINAGLIPVIEEIDNNTTTEGNVINCSPKIGSSVEHNSRVILYVAKKNIQDEITDLLEEGKYNEATILLNSNYNFDQSETLNEQIFNESYIHSIITELKNSSESPDTFYLHDITLYQFDSFKDIDGDGVATEDIVNHPVCLVKYSVSDSDILVAGFYFDIYTESPYQFNDCPAFEDKDIWNDYKSQYSFYSIKNFDLDHFTKIFNRSQSSSTETYTSYHICDADRCMQNGTNKYDSFTGQTEYYCDSHYNEMIDLFSIMEEDVGLENNSKHTCEVCDKEGTYSIIGFSGLIEYYCTPHYEEMKKLLEILTSP